MLHVEEEREVLGGKTQLGTNAKPIHRSRVIWNDELHERFLAAIEVAGSLDAAVPTVILKVGSLPSTLTPPSHSEATDTPLIACS